MPTAFSHPSFPLAAGLALDRTSVSWWLVAAGAFASILPDADVLAFRLGIPYANAFGHRGATHSVGFAIVLSMLAVAARRPLRASPRAAFLFVFAATLSHPVLDAFTNGGLGVALLWPFSDARFFSPFRPIRVAPVAASRFVGPRAWAVLRSEALWVWLPAAVACALIALARSRASRRRGGGSPDSAAPVR